MGILLLWGGGFARMALNLWASPECPYEWCFSHYFVISYFFQLCKCLNPSFLPGVTVLPLSATGESEQMQSNRIEQREVRGVVLLAAGHRERRWETERGLSGGAAHR